MNVKKIVIPCLYNNPELQTYERNEICNEEVPDDQLIERDVFFYNIQNIGPRLDKDGIVIGTIIWSGTNEYVSRLSRYEIDEIIRKTFEQ